MEGDGRALLDRLDAAICELQAVLAELAARLPPPEGVSSAYTLADSDFEDGNLIEISTAVDRFNRPADTLRLWCRREGCGKKVAGRWLASVPKIQRRLNGG